MAPTLLFPTSVFGSKIKIAYIATSPTSCHSIAITTTGQAYGWGRNETGQLGLGYTSPLVPIPTLLNVENNNESSSNNNNNVKFVGAGVGKYHTVLVGSNGKVYASGGNLCGQLGINNMGIKGIDRFRKCVVVGQLSGSGGGGGIEGEENEEEEVEEGVKIVQVRRSSCTHFLSRCSFHDVIVSPCELMHPNSDMSFHFLMYCVLRTNARTHTHLLYRRPVAKTSRPSSRPPAICTLPVHPNAVNLEMARLANISSRPGSSDMPTAANSSAVVRSSKVRPTAMA